MESRPIFKMADMKNLYITRLTELGLDQVQVHTTKLKDRILAAIPYLRSRTEGRGILLIYDEEIGTALKQACNGDCDSDALILAKASNIIRRDVFELTQSFNGRFPVDCQEKAQFLAALLTGPTIKDQCAEDKPLSHGAKTISQLIVFNSIRASKNHVSSTHRHNRDRETPAPIYFALNIHGETRDLITTIFFVNSELQFIP